MRYFILFAFLFAQSLSAQVSDTMFAHVHKEAQRCAEASVRMDAAMLLRYTHPNIIQAAGGNEAFIEMVNEAYQQLTESGMSIDTAYAEMPSSKIVEEQGELRCIVPNKMTIKADGSKFVSHSNLLGFSFDKGVTWCFVEAEKVAQEETRSVFFPKLKTDLYLPPDRVEMLEDK